MLLKIIKNVSVKFYIFITFIIMSLNSKLFEPRKKFKTIFYGIPKTAYVEL